MCLLDTLDLAFYDYNMARIEESKSHHNQGNNKSFLSGLFSVAQGQNEMSSHTPNDANFSNSLPELQLNWSETLDNVD